MSYFRRSEHALLLVGLGIVTYGVGGVLYWAARRQRRVCPACGISWKRSRSTDAPSAERPPPTASPELSRLPPDGLFRRVVGVFLAIVGIGLFVLGLIESLSPVLAVGLMLCLSGACLALWGRRASEDRRGRLLEILQSRVLALARERGGRLTATDAAAYLGLSLPATEKALLSMDDGFRVRSDITPGGLLVFEFPELQLELLPGGSSGLGRGEELR